MKISTFSTFKKRIVSVETIQRNTVNKFAKLRKSRNEQCSPITPFPLAQFPLTLKAIYHWHLLILLHKWTLLQVCYKP